MTSIVDGTWLCGAETLSVRQYLSQGGGLPILVLHGAGNAEQSRLAHLCEAFAKLGHTSVSFDFSGHGKSTAITAGSLQKRVIEAEQVANQYITSDFYIAAFSMSGHVAVHLTKILRVKGLLLFSPAVYNDACTSLLFGNEFRQCIRGSDNYLQSIVWRHLQSYHLPCVMVRPEYDEVIPEVIFDKFRSTAVNFKEFVLPNATHYLSQWIVEHPTPTYDLVQKALHFMKAKQIERKEREFIKETF